MGDLVCRRSGDGVSWLPPARPQADMREVMVVEDVLLQSTFQVLLSAGASGGPPPDWWPTQSN